MRGDGPWNSGGAIAAHRPGPLNTDYRIFFTTPRLSPSFARAYTKRTAVARFNSRIDNVSGFNDHIIQGIQKMRTPG